MYLVKWQFKATSEQYLAQDRFNWNLVATDPGLGLHIGNYAFEIVEWACTHS